MDNKEYGVKLTVDISDLKKKLADATKLAQNTSKQLENSMRKVKITDADGTREIEIKANTKEVEEAKKKIIDLKSEEEKLADVQKRISQGQIKITNLLPDEAEMAASAKEYDRIRQSMSGPIGQYYSPEQLSFFQDLDTAPAEQQIQDFVNGVDSAVKQVNNTISLGSINGRNIVKKTMDDMKSDTEVTWESMSSAISGKFDTATSNIKAKAQDVGNTIKTYLSDKGIGQGTGSYEKISNSITGLGEVAKDGAKKFNEFIKKLKETRKTSDNASSGLKKLKANTNSVSGAFSSGINSLKKFALSLFGVQSAWRVVSKAASAYLSMDTQLSESIQNTWAGLGSFLAPVLEYLAGAFQKLLAYANALMQALTGINFVARANAKAMNSASKATQKAGSSASKSLASFDELNNINQSTGSSGGDGAGTEVKQIEMPEVDTSKLEASIEKVKGMLATLFDPIKQAWSTTGPTLISSFQTAFNQILTLASEVGNSINEVWQNGTGQTIVEGMITSWSTVLSIVGNLAEAFTTAWTSASAGTGMIQSIADAFTGIQNAVNSVLNSVNEVVQSDTMVEIFGNIISIVTTIADIIGGLAEAFTNAWNNAGTGTTILQTMADIFKDVTKFVDLIAQSLKQWVLSESFQQAISTVMKWVKELVGYVKDFADWLLKMYDQYIKPLIVDKILPVIDEVILAIDAIWQTVKPVIDNVVNVIGSVLEPAIGLISNAIGVIFDVLKGVLQFITGVFTGNWKKAFQGLKTIIKGVLDGIKNQFSIIFNGIWKIVKAVINTMISGIESFANAGVKAINLLLGPIAKLGNSALKLIGVKNFKFTTLSKIKLPRLKIGTDNVNKEGFAYLHAGEKVVPADVVKGGYTGEGNNSEETNDLLRQLIDVIQDKDFNPYITVDDIGKASVKYINNKSRVTGGSVI